MSSRTGQVRHEPLAAAAGAELAAPHSLNNAGPSQGLASTPAANSNARSRYVRLTHSRTVARYGNERIEWGCSNCLAEGGPDWDGQPFEPDDAGASDLDQCHCCLQRDGQLVRP